jgi:two-component system, NtrC family, nitrogen regulation sensor histidine kinase GlnL
MKYDLQGIFDALLVGVVVLDDGGAVQFVNSEASRILGASDQHMPGKVLIELLGPDHPLCPILDRVRSSGRASIHDEVEFPRRDAPALPVEVAASPVRESSTPIAEPGIALTIRDRTASRSLHEEIRERERQESYGHIASGIAHEVKNPLGGIRGAAELLGLAASDDRGKKTAQLIVNEVDRISSLVDELMIFARGDHLNREDVNVHRLLDGLLDLLEYERGHEDIRVERHFDPSLPEIEADPARLQQVFLNLARNALQAMEGSGRLILSTRMSLEHRLVGSDGRPKPTIEVGFHDTGPGIPPHILDRLSTPFFTTKKKGTGLGLAVARHWIRRHGGRLRILSGNGEGTRVFVDLPVRAPDDAQVKDASFSSFISANEPSSKES